MSHRSVGERVVKLRVGIVANGGLVTEDNPTRNGVIVQEVNESVNVRSGRLEHETNRRVGGIVGYSMRNARTIESSVLCSRRVLPQRTQIGWRAAEVTDGAALTMRALCDSAVVVHPQTEDSVARWTDP